MRSSISSLASLILHVSPLPATAHQVENNKRVSARFCMHMISVLSCISSFPYVSLVWIYLWMWKWDVRDRLIWVHANEKMHTIFKIIRKESAVVLQVAAVNARECVVVLEPSCNEVHLAWWCRNKLEKIGRKQPRQAETDKITISFFHNFLLQISNCLARVALNANEHALTLAMVLKNNINQALTITRQFMYRWDRMSYKKQLALCKETKINTCYLAPIFSPPKIKT